VKNLHENDQIANGCSAMIAIAGSPLRTLVRPRGGVQHRPLRRGTIETFVAKAQTELATPGGGATEVSPEYANGRRRVVHLPDRQGHACDIRGRGPGMKLTRPTSASE
jgi:hypothetical protein